jgi:cellulose synthase/poly-beta-1,6-N-acetylglucosamine synthase-like glycosyltransferase
MTLELTRVALEPILIASLLGMIFVGVGFLTLPVQYLVQRMHTIREPLETTLPADDHLPDILVQLPVFNEAGVVTGLLDSVAGLEWPRAKLHIQLLDDSSDHTVEIAREKIAELSLAGLTIEHVCRDHRSGFKAEALAAGLERNKSPFVAILDADFRPPPNWLRAVLPKLLADPRAGFVQSRCEFANADANWLTRVQGLLFDAHFVMEQGVRANAGLHFQFNGTAAVWRRRAIEDAGGWSGDSLCEDLDLTIRAGLAGWHGVLAMNPVVPGLVPEQIEHWRIQQRRWAMGFAQIARKLWAVIWTSHWSLAERISAGFVLLYQAFMPMTVVAIVAGLADLALRSGHLPPLVLLLAAIIGLIVPTLALSMTLPPYIELRRGSLARYFATVIALPPLIAYLAFCTVDPILAGMFGRNDDFHRTPKEEPVTLSQEPAST